MIPPKLPLLLYLTTCHLSNYENILNKEARKLQYHAHHIFVKTISLLEESSSKKADYSLTIWSKDNQLILKNIVIAWYLRESLNIQYLQGQLPVITGMTQNAKMNGYTFKNMPVYAWGKKNGWYLFIINAHSILIKVK